MRRNRTFAILALLVLLVFGDVFAGEAEFTFTNGYDGSEQKAVAYTPDSFASEGPHPLLVVAHFMGGDRFTARRSGYYAECDARGYLCVCPELHGRRTPGQTSLAALEAQHDVIGAIDYMKANHRVDTTRIYIVGRSMGGMLAQMMAAKYPDLFAAAVSGQGISDLPHWYETSTPSLIASTVKECGELNDETRFDYERRSSVSFAPNLAYVPLILWHGTNDTWVPPDQSERIVAAVRKYNRFQSDVHWLHNAAHCPANYTAKWICDQLTYYQNVPEAGFGTPERFFPELEIVTDEAKRYFWLVITPADPGRFARVRAHIINGLVYVRTENVKELAVDLDHVSKTCPVSKYDVLQEEPGVRFLIIRGDTVLFDEAMQGLKTGALPESVN